VWTAALWGLVQGLTEFLPVSSSGHLVLVPAVFGADPPSLGTSAILHLGTLAAVVLYFRRDLLRLTRFRSDETARRLVWLLAIGTVPAAIAGLLLEDALDEFNSEPRLVAIALIFTGAMLVASGAIVRRQRTIEQANRRDAVLIGLAQATALIPGISRSGITITAGLGRGLTATEAARFSFLLAVPVIAGAGLLEMIDAIDQGSLTGELWVGVGVAAVSGYLAIDILLRLLRRAGLAGFGAYCLLFGVYAFVFV